MLRPFGIALCLLLLGACSADVKQAKQLLTEDLAIPKEVEFRRMKTYPGDVVCGDFSAYSSHVMPKEDFKPFIVVRGKLYREPDEMERAIFCSETPAQPLLELTGVGPYDADNAALAKIAADYDGLTSALEQYYEDNHAYPTVEQGLEGLVTPKPQGNRPLTNFPEGGYLASIPDDPWGNAYRYDEEQWGRTKGTYEVLTLGADAAAGGSGENADVSSDIFTYLDHVTHVLEQR